jgi:hypothetical protein
LKNQDEHMMFLLDHAARCSREFKVRACIGRSTESVMASYVLILYIVDCIATVLDTLVTPKKYVDIAVTTVLLKATRSK